MTVKIREFSVSSSLELFKNGEKSSHFVNVTCEADPGLTPEEFKIAHLKMGLEVAVAAVHHALVRKAMTEEEARERIRDLKENYSDLIQAVEKGIAKKSESSPKPLSEQGS